MFVNDLAGYRVRLKENEAFLSQRSSTNPPPLCQGVIGSNDKGHIIAQDGQGQQPWIFEGEGDNGEL
jgi:hypothetical protein